MDVTSTLRATYESFPSFFTDDPLNIPDKFDEQFFIVGIGNGIPDIPRIAPVLSRGPVAVLGSPLKHG